MNPDSKIYVTERSGFLGSAFARRLTENGYQNIIQDDPQDLENAKGVEAFFTKHKPEIVFLATGPTEGIQGNIKHPAELMYSNLVRGINVVSSSFQSGVNKLIYIASSCVYPSNIQQPMSEKALLSGPFEPTNEAYAIAKLATLKLCEAYNAQYKTCFISLIPANPYGPMDSFDPENAHVITALISKMHRGRTMTSLPIWGTGKALRDFLYVDDLADAAIFLVKNPSEPKTINVSLGQGISIAELAELIKNIVGFRGKLSFDSQKPEGMAKKVLDGSRIQQMGWKSKVSLKDGIQKTYRWYLDNVANKD